MTPQEFVEQHPITLELKRLGVTNDQLKRIRFNYTKNKGCDFDFWSFTWPKDIPSEAINLNLIKPYCALKWLIIENPPNSRDKQDAYRLVSETMAAPIYQRGLHRQEQLKDFAEKGTKARIKYTDADKQRWRAIANESALAHIVSKVGKAKRIANRLELPNSAVETIRRFI